jgi:hypothetical protein
MAGDWKRHHANEAEKAHEQPLVQSAVEEFIDNMKRNHGVDPSEGLPSYGLHKVLATAMIVARAEALGFDPELLRLSRTEATEQQLRLAQMAAEQGKPVWAIEAGEGESA